jgi:hypothetical protein
MESKECIVLTTPQSTSMRSSGLRTEPAVKSRFPTLITPDAQSGLKLAGELAEELDNQMDRARSKVERPGGMNFLLPPRVPPEIIGGILFYAIAAANNGWSNNAVTAATTK